MKSGHWLFSFVRRTALIREIVWVSHFQSGSGRTRHGSLSGTEGTGSGCAGIGAVGVCGMVRVLTKLHFRPALSVLLIGKCPPGARWGVHAKGDRAGPAGHASGRPTTIL